jgi:inhibitor of KinA
MAIKIETSGLGEHALLLRFRGISLEEAHHRLMRLHRHLTLKPFTGFVDSVPAYNSIAIIYDITKLPSLQETFANQVRSQIEKYLTDPMDTKDEGVTHIIPVKYGGIHGPDLETVAKENDISVEELIRLHTESIYPVYMIGFSGGFPYLGFTHEKLFTKRKTIPMQRVKAGSVALAGNQTGIYPFEGPGAWKIIGHTSYPIFDVHKDDPANIKPGDQIKFVCE